MSLDHPLEDFERIFLGSKVVRARLLRQAEQEEPLGDEPKDPDDADPQTGDEVGDRAEGIRVSESWSWTHSYTYVDADGTTHSVSQEQGVTHGTGTISASKQAGQDAPEG